MWSETIQLNLDQSAIDVCFWDKSVLFIFDRPGNVLESLIKSVTKGWNKLQGFQIVTWKYMGWFLVDEQKNKNSVIGHRVVTVLVFEVWYKTEPPNLH